MLTLQARYNNLKTLVLERKEPFNRLMHHLERFRAREPVEEAQTAFTAVCSALQGIRLHRVNNKRRQVGKIENYLFYNQA